MTKELDVAHGSRVSSLKFKSGKSLVEWQNTFLLLPALHLDRCTDS